jgi:hypothetical protein
MYILIVKLDNIAQNAGFCIKIFKIFVGGGKPLLQLALMTKNTKVLEGLVKCSLGRSHKTGLTVHMYQGLTPTSSVY